MSLRTAKVVRVNQTRRTVDLVFNDNGQRVADVQMVGNSSSDSGSWSVPDVPKPASEAGPDQLSPTARNLVATCDMLNGRPVVTGFLHPLDTQVAFAEPNREVHRHPSGAYSTVAPDGSIETFHPSGAYLRIGTGDHQDLATVSADGNWQMPAGAPPAQITLATAGFTLTVMPNGATTLTTTGPVVATFANMELHGDVKVFGALEVTGDVTGGTVSLDHHVHGGVQGGPGNTGVPVA